jgi:hypothetical protein
MGVEVRGMFSEAGEGCKVSPAKGRKMNKLFFGARARPILNFLKLAVCRRESTKKLQSLWRGV